MRETLLEVMPLAEEYGVCILIETAGQYANTDMLRDLLDSFASDTLGALWDMHYPYRVYGESAEKTIKNLGAYVKHVHLKDSDMEPDGSCVYRLIGEGTLPIGDMMNALSSINYDGFISLEWDPNWMSELDDMEIIFSHLKGVQESLFGKRKRWLTRHFPKCWTEWWKNFQTSMPSNTQL